LFYNGYKGKRFSVTFVYSHISTSALNDNEFKQHMLTKTSLSSQLGLQVLVCCLLDNTAQKVQVVTPKPPSTIVVLLKNGITAELKARGATTADEITAQRRDCLDRIMLSRVFDMDGLGEVLADLDATTAPGDDEKEEDDDVLAMPLAVEGQPTTETITTVQSDAAAAAASAAAVTSIEKKPQEPSSVAEIQDSQDEDETPSPSPSPPSTTILQPDAQRQDDKEPDNGSIAIKEVSKEDKPTTNTFNTRNMTVTTPDIILITHFSSLLTSFFTQRDKSAAHATLRLLASRLRHLSRTLPSNPLILLTNSTDSGAASSAPAHSSESHNHENPPSEQPAATASTYRSSTDPTLRSIFNPAHAGASPHMHGYKANKPTFGLVFTQLLDLHLLCTRAPRPSSATSSRAMTVVEVLLDEIGLWEGERGRRRRREQRWTIVVTRNGRIVDVPDSEKLKGTER
jgi:hypothetical protein